MYVKASNNTNGCIPHIPFALGSWELLLQSFFIFSFQDAEAKELGGPVCWEETQLRSAAHKAVWVVPVIDHSQLWFFRMYHLLGNPNLSLEQVKETKQSLGCSGKSRVLVSSLPTWCFLNTCEIVMVPSPMPAAIAQALPYSSSASTNTLSRLEKTSFEVIFCSKNIQNR